jgi:Glyoxalase-like domain
MPLAVDHVLFAALDLKAAAREVESRYGLASIECERHAAWGTANRIIPLGETYPELITVVGANTAAASAFGRRVAAGKTGRPLGWAVRTDSIDAIGKRLGMKPTPGVRTTPSGHVVERRSVGVAEPGPNHRCRSSSSGAMAVRFQAARRWIAPARRRSRAWR